MRECPMLEGTKVSMSDVKDELILQGNDIEKVSQSAASITDKCRVKDKDIRKFLVSLGVAVGWISVLISIGRYLHLGEVDRCAGPLGVGRTAWVGVVEVTRDKTHVPLHYTEAG